MNIKRDLEYFKPVNKDGYIEVILPVVIKIYSACLRLRIYNTANGFLIRDDGDTFYDANEDSEYYYNLYKKSNMNDYNILLKDDYFYKEYPSNFNINVALDEFIRFFINLDKVWKDSFNCE